MPVPAVADGVSAPDAGIRAARGGALRTAGFAVATLLGLISAPLLIRHLGVEDFGRYLTVLSLVTVVAGLTEGGMAIILQREYVSRSGPERTAVLRDLLGIRIALTVAGTALVLAFTMVAGYSRELILGTLVASGALLLQSVQTLVGGALAAELRFGWITVTEVLRQVLFVALTIALIVIGADLFPFFLAQVPVAATTLAMTVVLVRRVMPLRPSFHPGRWWTLLRDTFSYAVAVALNAMYFRVALVVLSLAASERETGFFATAFRVIELLVAVPALVVGAAFPILVRAASDDRQRLDVATARLIEIALVLGTGSALVIALGAEPIILVIAGEAYAESVGLLQIQAFAVMATFVAVAAGYVLLALRQHRWILAANAAALTASAGAAALLVPRSGATGAAVAVLIAEATLATLCLTALVRVRPATLLAVRRAPAVIAAGAVAGSVVFVPAIPVLLDAAVAAIVFVILLRLLRRFPPEAAEILGARLLPRTRHRG